MVSSHSGIEEPERHSRVIAEYMVSVPLVRRRVRSLAWSAQEQENALSLPPSALRGTCNHFLPSALNSVHEAMTRSWRRARSTGIGS